MNEAINVYTIYPEDFPDFNLLTSSTNIVLAGLSGYILGAEYQDSEFGKTMVLETGTLKDDINYFIRYMGSPSQFEHYIPIIQTMIESI